jgi:hypothetical protein
LLAEYPALLSWCAGDNGGLLGFATGSYGDSFDPINEAHFTRAACAELLIDAGAVVQPSVCEGLSDRARGGSWSCFAAKALLPATLEFHAALGDIDAVRAALDENGTDLAVVSDAFTIACGFKHEAAATLLLERCIALDPELGAHIDGSAGRHAFVSYFIENRPGTRRWPGCGRVSSWSRSAGRSRPGVVTRPR